MKLGVTGGIGSGKTSVCRMFSVLGIPVFSADTEARYIMENDPGIMEMINGAAGKSVYTNGLLERDELARLIFNNREMLDKVNAIVHPLIFNKFSEWALLHDSPYVILEAAILIESGSFNNVDRILTVTAPVEERIGRVMRRNSLTRDQVLERIRNQSTDDEKIKVSDYVIRNSEQDMIIPEVLKVHNEILREIKASIS